MAIAETLIKTTENLQIIPISNPSDSVQFPSSEDIESNSLRVLVCEKDARIEKLTEENQYLRAQIEKLEARMESEIKKSDTMIEQIQAAAEASSKRAQAIIMHLSQQVERQAEQIEILHELQGFSGTIRQTVKQLKSRILRETLAAG